MRLTTIGCKLDSMFTLLSEIEFVDHLCGAARFCILITFVVTVSDNKHNQGPNTSSESHVRSSKMRNYSSIILAHFNKYSGEQSYGLAYTIKF